MALSGAEAGTVYRSALALISSYGGRADEGVLARALQREYSYLPGQGFAAFQAVARRAIAATEAARSVNRRPVNAVPLSQLPVDPSIQPGAPRIQYRVVIEATSKDGTAQWSYAVDLQSETPLTIGEIRELARQQYEGRQPRRSYREQRTYIGDSPVLAVTVVSAGRRG